MSSLVSLFASTLILLDHGPILMASFNLNCLLRGPVLNTVILDVRAATCKFFRAHNSVPSNNKCKVLLFQILIYECV